MDMRMVLWLASRMDHKTGKKTAKKKVTKRALQMVKMREKMSGHLMELN